MAGWQDEESSFLSQFHWTTDRSPKQVAETYKTQLPVIVKVTSGYDGCDGMHEFAMDEVYCIVDIKKQKRVVFSDVNDRYISVPFDYDVKFHNVGFNNKPDGPARPISEICPGDSSSLNVNLRVMFEQNQAVKFNDGADLGSRVKLGVLEFDEVYKERYLVCHPLQSSEILSDVVLIPIYVPISLSAAEGFVQSPPDSFSGWMRCVSASVQAFDTTNIQPCTEIVVFEESPASDYTYISPLNLIQHSLKRNPSAQKDPEDQQRYLNVTQCKEKQRGRLSVLGAQLPPMIAQGQGQGQGRSIGASKTATSPGGPPLPPRGYNKVPSVEDIPPIVPDVPKNHPRSNLGQAKSTVTSSTPAKVTKDVKVAVTSSPAKTSKTGVTDPSRRPQLPLPIREQITGNATRIVKSAEDPMVVKEGVKKQPPTAAPKKSMPSKPAQDYRTADSIQKMERFGTSEAKSLNQCPPLINDCPPLIEDCRTRFKDNPSKCGDFADEVEYETLAEATVTLSPHDDKSANSGDGGKVTKTSSGRGWKGLAAESASKPSVTSSWKCIEDIPVDLDVRSLTVDEICRCLELLKMTKFSDQFRQTMVDGSLLLDLTNETLKEDFGMTLFDATKLMKFARDGWRPKTQ